MEDVKMAEEHQSVPHKIPPVNSEKVPISIDCICEFSCNLKINEETRRKVCNEFHSMSLERQRYFILRSVTEKNSREAKNVKKFQKNSGSDDEYFIYYKKKHRVCKEFFLTTLCILPADAKSVLLCRNQLGFFVEKGTQGEQITNSTIAKYEIDIADTNDEFSQESYNIKATPFSSQKPSSDILDKEKGEVCAVENPKHSGCVCEKNCHEIISKEVRIQIRKEFEKLSLPCRNDFLLSMLQTETPKVYRNDYFEYDNRKIRHYFLISKNQKHRVCKRFFQRTLGISRACIDRIFVQQSDFGTFKEGQYNKCVPYTKTKFKNMKLVKKHIESFPEIYTAINQNPPKKFFFDEAFTIRGMYRLYAHKCAVAGLEFVSEGIFKQYMKRNYDYTVKPIGERRYNKSKLVSTPPNTNPTIVKYEIDIDDTDNGYLQDHDTVDGDKYTQKDYEVGEKTEVVAGQDCFTIYEIKS